MEKDEVSGAQQITMCVYGDISPGSLQFEVLRGAFVCKSQIMLLTRSDEEAKEFRMMERTSPSNIKTLVYDMGVVMEANWKFDAGESHSDIAAHFQGAPSSPDDCCHLLAPFTVQNKWPHLLTAVLRASICMSEVDGIMEKIERHCVKECGISLMQLTVRTKSKAVLKSVFNWAEDHNIELKSCRPGFRNLTALHFAAMLRDDGYTAEQITYHCSDALDGWEGAKADDGSSPLAFATRSGTQEEIERGISRAVKRTGMAASRNISQKNLWYRDDEPVEAREASDEQTEGGDLQHIFSSNTETTRLLDFTASALEGHYKTWFDKGQVWVDLSFMSVALLSHAAWMTKWDFRQSLLISASMTVLMLFNMAAITMAIFAHKAYVHHREKFCAILFLLHKCALLLVSGAPNVGIIYSSSFSPAVALLESSSFSQNLVLCFGARPRFKVLMPILACLLLISSILNGEICASAFPSVGSVSCQLTLFLYQTVFCCALPATGIYYWEKSSRQQFLRHLLRGKKSLKQL